MKNTVLLISVVEKCWPDETKMKCHILEKLRAKEFTEALRVANEGINIGKTHMPELHMILRSSYDRGLLKDLHDSQKHVARTICIHWFGVD